MGELETLPGTDMPFRSRLPLGVSSAVCEHAGRVHSFSRASHYPAGLVIAPLGLPSAICPGPYGRPYALLLPVGRPRKPRAAGERRQEPACAREAPELMRGCKERPIRP